MVLDQSVAYGVGAAICWGFGDFLAKGALVRGGFLRTVHLINLTGIVAVLVLFLIYPSSLFFSPASLPLLLGISLMGFVAQLAFYRAFEIGRLSVVSPITSIYPAVTILLALLVLRESPGMEKLVGAALALVGIGLLSFQEEPGGNGGRRSISRGVAPALVAMAAIGSLLFAIKFALDIAGPVVPLLFIRVFNAIAFGTLFYAAPTDPRPDPKLVWRVLPIGSMDTAAFVLYNFGIGVGLVSVVSAVSGLYSAVTVFLAWAILRERTSWVQRIALGPVFAGAVLLSIQA